MIDLPPIPWEGSWEPLLGPWRRNAAAKERPLPLSCDAGLIVWALRKGWHPVLISHTDAWALSRNWFVTTEGYVVTHHASRQRYLHRLIEWVRREGVREPDFDAYFLISRLQVDHRDRSTLNNLRTNLRLVDTSINNFNHAPLNASLGVYFDEATEKWRAILQLDGKRIHVGRFSSERQAAKAIQRSRRVLERERLRELAPALAAATCQPEHSSTLEASHVPF